MSVINKLASSLNRRDEVPNQELAKQIAAKNDKTAIKELVENLNNKKKDIQSDCIKVLYETGTIKPALIAPYLKEFAALLGNKNNRLQWGAMTALSSIVKEEPAALYKMLPEIIAVADKGSVITRDHCVNILISLCAIKEYASKAFPLLIEQILKSPVNQVAMYAERALPVINDKNKTLFVKTLTARLNDFEKESQRKRVEKVIKKLS